PRRARGAGRARRRRHPRAAGRDLPAARRQRAVAHGARDLPRRLETKRPRACGGGGAGACRTTTGSTGKAPLADALHEAGIEDAAQPLLVEVATEDAFCYRGPAAWLRLAQQLPTTEHPVG